MITDTKPYFDQFFKMTDEAKSVLMKPIEKRKLKRRFNSALKDVNEKLAGFDVEVFELSQNVSELNINRLLEIEDEIELCKKDKDRIKSLYRKWFHKEIRDDEDDEE